MEVKWDPTLGGRTLAPDTAKAKTEEPANRALPATTSPQAMDKPKTVPLPAYAQTHPANTGGATRPSAIEVDVDRLRELLRSGKAENRRQAGAHALALAASARLRRSRGARALAVELCDDVAESVEEHKALADRLKEVLLAEGDLHDTSAEGTLKACLRLVRLFDREGDPT